MAEYVKKEDVIKAYSYWLAGLDIGFDHSHELWAEFETMPAADVVERRTGKWVGGELGYCTCCGYRGCASDMWADGEINFCPHCGAKMMGEDNG